MKTYQLPLLMLATGTLLCTTLSCAEAEDKSWVGENVLPTKRAKDIPFSDNVGDKQVNYVFSGQWPIKVRDDRDGRLRIHDGHHEGWVAKTDFVLVADAPAYFDRRIETNPKDAFAWFMHGSGWNEKGEYDKAIKDYDEAIRLDPKFHQAFNNRSVSWRDKKEYDKAIEDCNEAIRLEPKYALAYANRAAAWKLKKDLDQAIKDYDEAIRLDPKFTRYFYSRGDTWMMKKDYDHAIKDFDEAIRLDPKYATAYYGKAGCLALKGQRDAAIEALEHALELGYRNFDHMEKDDALKSIRDEPAYKKLVKQYGK
jgi:tetratricopeptide (TPR) repeat protein